MFVETVTAPRDEWERFAERLRTLDDPPPALFVSVVSERTVAKSLTSPATFEFTGTMTMTRPPFGMSPRLQVTVAG